MPVATLLTLSSKKILSFRLIPQIGCIFDASVEQFAYDNKEEKEAILQGDVVKTRQIVLYSLHFFEVIAISVQIDTISSRRGNSCSRRRVIRFFASFRHSKQLQSQKTPFIFWTLRQNRELKVLCSFHSIAKVSSCRSR
jgi:hypothetical protein